MGGPKTLGELPEIFDTKTYYSTDTPPAPDIPSANQLLHGELLPAHRETSKALPLTIPQGGVDDFVFRYARFVGAVDMIRALGGSRVADDLINQANDLLIHVVINEPGTFNINPGQAFSNTTEGEEEKRGLSKKTQSPGLLMAYKTGRLLTETFLYCVDSPDLPIVDDGKSPLFVRPTNAQQVALYNKGKLDGALDIFAQIENRESDADAIRFNN